MHSETEFQKKTQEMLKLAATRIPEDVVEALERAKKREEKKIAETQLETILKNLKIAKREKIPLCQDTGIPIFFVRKGRQLKTEFSIKESIERSIKKATDSVPLRPNVVDPISRKNSGNNLGEKHPIIHTEITEGEKFEMELMLKGAGSENWSKLFMLNPTGSPKDITGKVVETADRAGGQICPPSIIGLGIGGTADKASLMAKEALLRPLNEQKKNGEIGEMERKIKEKVNELGIGPMGLGGKTTTLDVKIEKAGCHTASLPLAINFQCWAARRAKASLKDGKIVIEAPKK